MSERPPHTPGKYNPTVSVRNKYETALEKAIINKGFSYVNGEKIQWLDGELPIEAKHSDYKRLDLLGLDSSGRYVLCELKFSGDGEGNKGPADADGQLMDYGTLVRSYGRWFRIHTGLKLGHLFDLQGFISCEYRLMVAADQSYWANWKGKNGRRTAAHKRKLTREIEHYSIRVTVDDFEKQKVAEEKGRYEPMLPSGAVEWDPISCADY